MPADVLAGWKQIAKLDGWYFSNWGQTAEICSWIHNAARDIRVTLGVDPKDIRQLSSADILRLWSGKKLKKKKRNNISAKQLEKHLSRLHGD